MKFATLLMPFPNPNHLVFWPKPKPLVGAHQVENVDYRYEYAQKSVRKLAYGMKRTIVC